MIYENFLTQWFIHMIMNLRGMMMLQAKKFYSFDDEDWVNIFVGLIKLVFY